MRVTQRCLACGKDFPTTHPDGFRAYCSLGCEADALAAFETPEDKTHKCASEIIRSESEWVMPCTLCFRMTHQTYKDVDSEDASHCCGNHSDEDIKVARKEWHDALTDRKIPGNRYLLTRPISPQPYKYVREVEGVCSECVLEGTEFSSDSKMAEWFRTPHVQFSDTSTTVPDEEEDETHKCSCGNTGSPPDVCPYESEINGNDIPCGCCFSCRSECAERI